VTLCGILFDSPRLKGTTVHDERDGFYPEQGPACQQCADRADRIQNGPTR
jgi:hypothetical protein